MEHAACPYYFKGCAQLMLAIVFLSVFSCTQSYAPPAIKGNNNFLVVDGFINTGSDSTIFNLSNSVNLGDSAPMAAVTGAQILVQGSGGYSSQLLELGNGRYGSAALNLDTSQQYRVSISTPNGNQYLSKFTQVLQTPPIDSISWKQLSSGVQLLVSTHDPQQQVNYYQWQFAETWEYHANFFSYVIFVDSVLVSRDSSQETYACWSSANSTDILVGSSAGLSQGIIFDQPLTTIPSASVKLSVEYSILVKQSALTKEAYTFWENLKANTEELGNLFGPLPSEVSGNIVCVNNPSLPVLGYVSAGNVQEQRIFINNLQLNDWGYSTYCEDSLIHKEYYYPNFSQDGWAPVSYNMATDILTCAPTFCVDCTLAGPGNLTKPSFWQ
jgi:hypothetical protein